MQICHLRQDADTIPAIFDGQTYFDARAITPAFDAAFFAAGGLAKLRAVEVATLPQIQSFDSFAPCVLQPSKIVCVGLNYHDHAKEAGMDAPKEPVLFFKSPSSLSGANDPILMPPGCEMLDWEVELAFVIGQRAKRVMQAEALEFVAGYMILNDLSDRHAQLHRGGQWSKGKCYDSFAPIGPYLDLDVADPHDLTLTLSVNDELVQNGSSADFIFDVPTVIEHITEFMTLEPGDIVTTGTPAGVGLGMTPQRFLSVGDQVKATISGLGQQSQTVEADC